MSDLGFNKIAFCVLGTGLMLIGLNEASHALFPEAHHDKDAYFVEVPEAPAAGETAVAEGPRDYFALISAASADAGREVAVKCQQCHTFEQGGATLQGPNLYGVVGRDVASVAGFKYSTGPGSLTELEGVWDYEKLDLFIERPKRYRPATNMNFLGIGKQTDRANLTAYLRTLTAGEPLPLPPPLPPEATAAAPPAEGTIATDPSAPSQGAAGAPGATLTPGQPAPGAATAPGGQAPTQAAPTQPASAQPSPSPGQH
jgi:cytochrome c